MKRTIYSGTSAILIYIRQETDECCGTRLQRLQIRRIHQCIGRWRRKEFERFVDDKAKNISEKQFDVYIAYENAYDIAFLISGDEDYMPAVEMVQQKGKVVVAVSASAVLSQFLKRRADKYILLDNNQMERNKTFFYHKF